MRNWMQLTKQSWAEKWEKEWNWERLGVNDITVRKSIDKKRKSSSQSRRRKPHAASSLPSLYTDISIRKCAVGQGCCTFIYEFITLLCSRLWSIFKSLTWIKDVASWASWKFYRKTEAQVFYIKDLVVIGLVCSYHLYNFHFRRKYRK